MNGSRYQPHNLHGFYDVYNARIIQVFVLVILLMGLLIWRLAHVQVVQHKHFVTESDNNRIHIKAIAPVRGKIYDRNGQILAGNNLSLNLGVIREHSTDITRTIRDIRKHIELDYSSIRKFKRAQKIARAYEPVILKRKLTESEVARIEANSYHLPGVVILTQYNRFYKHAVAFSHVVGYVGKINKQDMATINAGNYRQTENIGKTGVEKYYEGILLGKVGSKRVETNVQGKILRTISVSPSVSGSDLFLTIDAKLQDYAHKLLENRRASLVAIDPTTSEVLAMVSTPGFDTNLFVNGISHADYNALRDSPDLPLFNRSINGQYPPGSTFKPFMALAGLENNVINANHEIKCKGFYSLKNSKHKFRDWKKAGHGHTNLHKAIVQSCDVYFYDLAFNLTIDRIHPYASLFGFGKKTNIDMPYEYSGLMPSRHGTGKYKRKGVWIAGDTLNVSIGQGKLQATPLQLAQATAVLANKGKGWSPNIVYRVRQSSSENLTEKERRNRILVPIKYFSNWEKVLNAMIDVVHSNRGTAKNINRRLKYKIAGKTGTSQVFTIKQNERYDEKTVKERLRDHALFISFAPAHGPKIAVAVVVENGKHGSTAAAPIARKVMDKYLLEIAQVVPD